MATFARCQTLAGLFRKKHFVGPKLLKFEPARMKRVLKATYRRSQGPNWRVSAQSYHVPVRNPIAEKCTYDATCDGTQNVRGGIMPLIKNDRFFIPPPRDEENDFQDDFPTHG